jgi:hypothetical protein
MTAVPYSALGTNGAIADPAGTSIGAAGTGTIANAVPEQTVLRVVNGAAATSVVLKAGSLPLAIASGQGDKTVAVGANATEWIGPIESGRFLQNDGSLSFTSSAAVTVTAFKVAKN